MMFLERCGLPAAPMSVKTAPQRRIFLTAEWKNLAMLNYVVDPDLLRPFVPSGTALDEHEGHTYVSLIGFEFNKTRMLGRAVPFHQSFEEVNLRCYVRRGSRRGVVFIRELVPKIAVTIIARLAYGERYSCVPMDHAIEHGPEADRTKAEYAWGSGVRRCAISVLTGGPGYMPAEGSLSEFISEHYWGYATRVGSTVEYQVEHPPWQVKDASSAKFSGDAVSYYGPEFGEVLARMPDSACFVEGSGVTVFQGMVIN